MTQTINAIDLLLQQHEEIRRLFREVDSATGDEQRQQAFDQLRELIAVHETAEEMVVRPVTKRAVPNGEKISEARFEEENEGKEALAELEKLEVSGAEFKEKFRTFHTDVEEHAQHEESEEFPALRANVDDDELQTMAERIRKAEAAAPTHAHPSAKNNMANVVLGPFASMVDRIRDALAS